jgi:hypothetical protein
MKKLKTPCKSHKIAIPDFETPEFMGISSAGGSFVRCKKCGWWALGFS